MLQWFIRFPEFTEFNESSALFRKKSNDFLKKSTNIWLTMSNRRFKSGLHGKEDNALVKETDIFIYPNVFWIS